MDLSSLDCTKSFSDRLYDCGLLVGGLIDRYEISGFIPTLRRIFVSLSGILKHKRQYDQLFTDRRTDQELRRFGSF